MRLSHMHRIRSGVCALRTCCFKRKLCARRMISYEHRLSHEHVGAAT